MKPLVFDKATLKALSHCLLNVARTARQAEPEHLLRKSLLELQCLVPFRSAWWGECSDGLNGIHNRNWMHGRINLSASFAEEWNQLAPSDAFAAECVRDLGSVVRISGYADPVHEITLFTQRYDLFHSMAITLRLPGSGLLFFVALYRGKYATKFDDNESVLFTEFFSHLLHHWEICVQDVKNVFDSAATGSFERFALANACGDLVYVGKQLGAAIHEAHPQWVGSRLPLEIQVALQKVPRVISMGQCGVTLQPYGALIALVMDNGPRKAALPPRERTVAILYSQGQSYKVIAKQLNLSPSTVRTYLRNAYLQLGVRNKIELGIAMHCSAAYGYP